VYTPLLPTVSGDSAERGLQFDTRPGLRDAEPGQAMGLLPAHAPVLPRTADGGDRSRARAVIHGLVTPAIPKAGCEDDQCGEERSCHLDVR
jgi:hypothetical protein